LAFFDELIPLYPVYALLFADAGLSGGQISALFALWSAVTFALEIPSGALADRMSRRQLIAAAALLRAVGFALWLSWPSFVGFALGFLLWGANSALVSGAWEALVYDELAALGASGRYARTIGRAEVAGATGVLAGTALAAPLIAVGGYPAAGWASVALCGAGAALALTLPDRPAAASADGAGLAGYLRTLRAGVSEAARRRVVRRALLAAALLAAFTAVEEYLPLLTEGMDLAPAVVPLLLLVPALATAVGAELAGRAERIAPRQAAALVAAAAAVFAAGVLWHHPAGFVGIALGYGGVWCVSLVAGARLQDTIAGPRATVTSVAGFGTETTSLAFFALVGAGSGVVALPMLVAAMTLPVLLVAAVLPRWLPPAEPGDH